MTQPKDVTPHRSPSGQVSSQSEESTFRSFQASGAEGYIALGSIMAGLVEAQKIPEIENYLMSLTYEDRDRIRSHAASILEDGTNKRVQREISRLKKDLWIEAAEGGIRSTLDSHRVAVNTDIDGVLSAARKHREKVDSSIESLKDEIRKSNSTKSLIKNSIVSGLAFGLFLIVVDLVDNPFANFVTQIINALNK